jgi:hypothetical protein
MGEGGGMVHMRWWWWGGATFGRTSGGGELRPKKSRTERLGSVSGTPSEMGVEGNWGRWWDGAYEVVVVGWCCVWSHKWGWGA